MKQGYHGSCYLVTWESQPHHLSREIKRVGPVDRPWPVAGAALLPRHGGFTSGLRILFLSENKSRMTSSGRKVRSSSWSLPPWCASVSIWAVTLLSLRSLQQRHESESDRTSSALSYWYQIHHHDSSCAQKNMNMRAVSHIKDAVSSTHAQHPVTLAFSQG